MEESTLQNIYDGFAGQMNRNLPITTPDQQAAYPALYRNILPQLRQAISQRIHEINQRSPDEVIERMEEGILQYRRFEATYAPV